MQCKRGHLVKLLYSIGGFIIAAYIKLVFRTSRIVYEPLDAGEILRGNHPLILGVWHGQFMLQPMLKPADIPASVMVARHNDAEIIGRALKRLGVGIVRGAGAGGRRRDRGGASALRGALKLLGSGNSFVMTADVPPGPARKAGKGIVLLAKISGCSIVPSAIASRRYIALKNWSRFTINLPFSRLAVVVGKPISIDCDADDAVMEEARLKVGQKLNEVTARAYELAGSTDPLVSHCTRPGSYLRVYKWLTSALAPVAPAFLAWRQRSNKEDPDRLCERMGEPGILRPEGRLLWLHAASVGETMTVLPLIERLLCGHEGLQVLLTTGTRTSAELAAKRLPKNAIHQYAPLDLPKFVRKFLDYWQPDVALFVESEIWPNMIMETTKRHVPLVMVNGRMSKSSHRKWRRYPGFSRPLFGSFATVIAQNELYARRFAQIGAENVITCGNLKVDIAPPPVNRKRFSSLKEAIGARPLFIAASTHRGEDEVILRAHKLAKKKLSGFLTIIIPRHPDRATEIAKLARQQNLAVSICSREGLVGKDDDIHIADTIGELGTFYSLAKVAFIGGSLIKHGGQNPIEAIGHDAAVITGPYYHNFEDIYEGLLECAGAIKVCDHRELAESVVQCLSDNTMLAATVGNAKTSLQKMSGSLEKTLVAVDEALDLKP
jgi:3-deoxy-D-manno-octulosonic-acid transferase